MIKTYDLLDNLVMLYHVVLYNFSYRYLARIIKKRKEKEKKMEKKI